MKLSGNIVSHVYKGERNIQQYFVTANFTLFYLFSYSFLSFIHSFIHFIQAVAKMRDSFRFSQPLPSPVGFPVSLPFPPTPWPTPIHTTSHFIFPPIPNILLSFFSMYNFLNLFFSLSKFDLDFLKSY